MQIRIFHDRHEPYEGFLDGPTELGRQRHGEPDPYTSMISENRTRLVIAPAEETTLSRSTLLIEPLPAQQVRLCNLSTTVRMRINDSIHHKHEISPGRETVVPLPLQIQVGDRQIQLVPPPGPGDHVLEDEDFQHLARPTHVPTYQESMESLVLARNELGHDSSLDWDRVIDWLRSAMSVLQVSANSKEFFQSATEAAAGLVGLDSSRVLVYHQGEWQVKSLVSRGARSDTSWKASMSVLDRVRHEKRTFWKSTVDLGVEADSLTGMSSVVAAPILNSSEEVIAVLYGDRRMDTALNVGSGLTEVDATLMELLACGIAAGLARVEQERAALTAQTRFEEFFTPRLSRRLMNDASLLEGQEREVTILFCDVRRFSSITEQLGPRVTVSLLNDIMSEISEAILQRDGVLVDYAGDEVMAMWGAPEDQPRHARLACEAALSILGTLPDLNERWKSHLRGETIDVGIGINTGRAFVGNIGSHRKFKYGPLGNAVNQASRIQGATKYFRSRLLISSRTLVGLSPGVIQQQTRCVGRVQVVNIEEPVSLYELVPEGEADFPVRKTLMESFEQSLSHRQPDRARETLQELLANFPEDGPAQAYQNQLSDEDSDQSWSIDPDGSVCLRQK